MTTDTLQDYEALIESGFSELQAKAMVRTFASPPTDPQVLNRLDKIEIQLEKLDLILERFEGLEREVASLKEDNRKLSQNLTNLDARVQILEDRIRTETRLTRMINTTLIALGALAATLASILTR